MENVSDEEFDAALEEALGMLPVGIADHLDNIALFVDDNPPADMPGLLGLYEGTPLTERGAGWEFQLPDAVFLYKSSLIAYARDLEELRDEIAITIVHEIAHHHGIDDEKLHEWGWG